jgi:hypothetical protein
MNTKNLHASPWRAQLALLELLLLRPRPCDWLLLLSSLALAACTCDTPAPRRDRAMPPAPRRAAHRRVPTSPTPVQRPRRLYHFDAHALNAAVASAPKSPLFAETTSCRNPSHHPRRTSSRDAPATLRAYKWVRTCRARHHPELAKPPNSVVRLSPSSDFILL